MKVALVAYGHADNVICLANNLSQYAEVTLIYVMSGKRFTNSVFDSDIDRLPYGFTKEAGIVDAFLGEAIGRYRNPLLSIYLARTPTLKFFTDWKLVNYRYIKDIALEIARDGYDVVHFNGSSGFQLYFHHFLRKMPKILTIHDYIPHSGDASLRGILVNIALNGLYTKFDYEFIQHHDYLTRKFVDFYKIAPHRVHTVYSGTLDVYKAFVNEDIDEEPDTVLFFGRISSYKGIEYLIRAVPKVKKKITGLKVFIAGNGRFGFKVPKYDFLEINNRYIPNHELVRLLQRASVVVTPYTDATHSAVIMTAFAFQKPVVASAVGGIPEVVENDVTGKLVPPRDADALADALIDLLQDGNKRNMMKRNIARLSERGDFSWDNIAGKTLGVYEKAIDGKGR